MHESYREVESCKSGLTVSRRAVSQMAVFINVQPERAVSPSYFQPMVIPLPCPDLLVEAADNEDDGRIAYARSS